MIYQRVKGRVDTLPHFKRWCEESRLTLDSGDPFVLEAFQAAFLRDVFRGEFSELWLVIPEGNAKTTLMALLGLYHLEHRTAAWCPWAASSRDQAEIGYRQAEGFVLRSSRLRNEARFVCQEGYRRVKCMETRGRMQIFAADASTGDGVIPTKAFIDELHRHKSLALYRTWAGKIDKRDGQLLTFSTAGEPGSEFELQREAMRQQATRLTRRGRCYLRAEGEDTVLHEYAVPPVAEGGDPEDLRLVLEANPLRAITMDRLKRKRRRSTWNLAHWSRFTCNMPTRSVQAAITEAEWRSSTVADQIPKREPIWLGLDVAWKLDTTAMVPLWWRDEHYRLLGDSVILEPPGNGDSLDPHLVEAAILQIHARNPIEAVVMDPSKAEQLAQWLSEELDCTVIERGQGNALAVVDYQKFTEALRLGQLKHRADPGLSRHVMNAIARLLPGGDTRFDRPTPNRSNVPEEQQRRVIDALTASAMVHSEAAIRFGGEGGFDTFTDEEIEAAMAAA